MIDSPSASMSHEAPDANPGVPVGGGLLAVCAGVGVVGLMFAVGLGVYLVLCLRPGVETPALPMVLWFSTALLVLSSILLHFSALHLHAEHTLAARRSLISTGLVGIGFVSLQVPGLLQLLDSHQAATAAGSGLYGVVLILVILHALHVLVGLVVLGSVAGAVGKAALPVAAVRVRMLNLYWRTLTLIWIVMFSVFWT